MSVWCDSVLFQFPCEGLIWEAKLINCVSLLWHRSMSVTLYTQHILTKDGRTSTVWNVTVLIWLMSLPLIMGFFFNLNIDSISNMFMLSKQCLAWCNEHCHIMVWRCSWKRQKSLCEESFVMYCQTVLDLLGFQADAPQIDLDKWLRKWHGNTWY